MADGCATSQLDAWFENLCKLTWFLTWTFLRNPCPCVKLPFVSTMYCIVGSFRFVQLTILLGMAHANRISYMYNENRKFLAWLPSISNFDRLWIPLETRITNVMMITNVNSSNNRWKSIDNFAIYRYYSILCVVHLRQFKQRYTNIVRQEAM